MYSVSARKYFRNLQRSWLELALLLVSFILPPPELKHSSQKRQASPEASWICRSTLKPGSPGLEGAPRRARQLSSVGESRHRSATNFRSTALGSPAVSLQVNNCSVAHRTALKSHAPCSVAQLEHCSCSSAARWAEYSSTSTSRMASPHSSSFFILTLEQFQRPGFSGCAFSCCSFVKLKIKSRFSPLSHATRAPSDVKAPYV